MISKFYISKFTFTFLLSLFAFQNYSTAATITAVASGNWSATSTWNPAQVPGAGDDVIIGAFNVTVDADASVNDVSLTDTASHLRILFSQTLTIGGKYSSIAKSSDGINGPGTLLFIGNTTINSIFTEFGTFPHLTIGSSTSANNVIIDTFLTIERLTVVNNATLEIDTLAKLIVWANLKVNGTGSGNGAITGKGTLNLAPSNHMISGSATISVATFNTTVGSSNIVNFSGTGDPDGAAMLLFTGDSVINVSSGPTTNVNPGADLTFSSSTIFSHRSFGYFTNYGTMTVNGTVAGALNTAGSSRFNNAGTIIMNGGPTGTISIGSSNTFYNNATLTFNNGSYLTIGTSTNFTNEFSGIITFTGTSTGTSISGPGSGYITNNGTINSTGVITLPSTARLFNNGTINSTASVSILTVSINTSSICINNGTINSTGTGNITLLANATFYNNGTVTIADSITGANASSSRWVQGSKNAVLNIAGALLPTGVLIADSVNNTINYNGVGQTIKTPSNSRYDKLQISTSTIASMAANITVNSTLILTNGRLNTGAYTLIVDSTAAISGGSDTAYVNGNLQKNFPVNASTPSAFKFTIGDATYYAPVDVDFASITTAGSLTAKTIAAEHSALSSSNLLLNLSVNRYWSLTNTGMVFTTADATFNWVTSDMDAGVNTTKLSVGKYDSPTWTYPSVANLTATSIQATGITSFSDFAVAQLVGTGVPSHTNENIFALYPNPSKGSFVIALDNFKDSSIKIFDCQGKEVYNKVLTENSNTIDLSVEAGIYFVKLIDDDKQYLQKIVIE